MSAIIRLLDTEIAKYEGLIRNLKASRDAIAAAEALPAATTTKRRGRPPKSAAKNGTKNGTKAAAKKPAKSTGTGRKRGRPRKNATPSGSAPAAPATAPA